MAHDETATDVETRRERFAELVVSGHRASDAGAAIGISRATAFRWLRDEQTEALIHDLRADVRRRNLDALTAANATAIVALVEVATKSKSDVARVAAARTILEQTLNAVEVFELEARIDEMAELLAGAAPVAPRDAARLQLAAIDVDGT
jgi:hypothetical protein